MKASRTRVRPPFPEPHEAFNFCGLAADISPMLVRTRLMLECPHCRESKLINVTILDEVVGPVMCEACVAEAIVNRRLARPAEPATPHGEPDGNVALDVDAA
jgi:hypothetical protein